MTWYGEQFGTCLSRRRKHFELWIKLVELGENVQVELRRKQVELICNIVDPISYIAQML